MSDQEISDLNRRLEQLSKDGQDRERKHDLAHQNFDKKMDEIVAQNKRQFQMLEPMYKIFTSVQGFNGISAVLIKGIIALGAAGAVIYGVIKWLKS